VCRKKEERSLKIAILHLSDIHLRNKGNSVFEKIESIGNAVKSELYGVDELIVLISGDLAFSGKAIEYELGMTLIEGIKDSISKHRDINIKTIIIPGNHDCDFQINKSVRSVLLQSVQNNQTELSHDIITEISKPQENYFIFEDLYEENASLIFKDKLFKQYEFLFGENKIVFNCLNTAWVSELHEQPSKMIFPLEKYIDKFKENPGGLVISVFHHPFHWLQPMNNRLNKEIIEEYSDLVFTGHEHVPTFKQTTDLEKSLTGYFEGGALQTNNPEESEFNFILIDFEERKQKICKFQWNYDKYNPYIIIDWSDLRIGRPSTNILEVNKDYLNYLNEVGITIIHPQKTNIILEEVYVYPDAKILQLEQHDDIDKYINLSELKVIKEENKIILTGEEQIGKSTFCKMIYHHYLTSGYIPVLIDGRKLNTPSIEEFNKTVYKNFCIQYSENMLEDYKQLIDEKKLIIIDDFDKAKLNSKYLLNLLMNINKYYKHIIITGNELFKFQELLFSEVLVDGQETLSFHKYEIMHFGHRLRSQLINKWNSLGDSEWLIEEKELISKNDYYENTINTIIGNNYVPSVPFFILVMLQTLESGNSHNLSESTYGYYYEHLIRQAFININIKNEDIDAFYNYITELAFVFFEDQEVEKTSTELNDFNIWYCREYDLLIDFSSNISKLIEASILLNIQDTYRFKYKYIYYYFVARYLANNINEPLIREKISYMSSKLYIEEYANIIMFLTHLSKDPFVLNEILKNSEQIFCEYEPAQLESDVVNLNKMIADIPQLIIEDKDVKKHREERLYVKDELERSKQEVAAGRISDEALVEELDVISKLNWSFKTLEILGQILKNYYGSIKGSQKITLGKEAYFLGLRSLGSFLTLLDKHGDSMVNEIEKILLEKQVTSNEEIKKMASHFVFNLCCAVSFQFIKKVSTSVGSDKLAETFKRILEENNTVAINLIDLSIKLDHIQNIPFSEIENIKEELKRNNLIGYSLLRGLVVNYLYMFKTNYKEKQRICSMLDISIDTQRKKELLVTTKR
jgi:hypothetical protein